MTRGQSLLLLLREAKKLPLQTVTPD